MIKLAYPKKELRVIDPITEKATHITLEDAKREKFDDLGLT